MLKVFQSFSCVLALVVAAPENPAITPAPLHPRTEELSDLLGYYFSNGFWNHEVCNEYVTSVGDHVACCLVGTTCTIWTGCFGAYKLAPETSVLCASDYTCGYDYILNTLNEPTISAKSYIRCWPQGARTSTFYLTNPEAIIASTSSKSNPTTTPPATSTTESPFPTTPAPSSSTSQPNVGAITGGTVGGVAVIGLTVAFWLFLRHRRKKNQDALLVHHASALPPGAQMALWPATASWNPALQYQSSLARQSMFQPGQWTPHQSIAKEMPGPLEMDSPHMRGSRQPEAGQSENRLSENRRDAGEVS